MGKEIVRQQSITMPEKRNRLWFYKDLIYVLEKNMENDEIEAMVLDMPEDKEVQWNQEVLGRMKKLRMLVKKNACFFGGPKNLPSSLRVLEWWKYPEASLPHNFHSKNLVILNLSYSSFQWNKQLENSEVLSQLIFTGCVDIRQIPDVSGIPNLTELCVDDCTNLIGIHDSVGFLDKLLSFSAKGCSKLRIVPHGIRLTSLEYLCLRDCCSLIMFPEILGPMERLEFVDLEGTAIKNLPLSMQNLKGVQRLYLNRCRMIESNALSDIIQRLPNLFPFLKSLRLRGSSLTILPECIEECRFLELLDLCYCKQLREIRGLPLSTDDFLAYNCTLLKANCSTLNMLIQSRAIRSATRKFFVLPGKRIPEWFDHSSRGNSLCFWFRKDFPSITVSAVLGVVENIEDPFYVNFHFYVKINDIEIPFGFDFNYILETDHIFMFKSFTDPKYWGQGGLLSENEWNYGEVLFVIPPDSGCTGSIKCTGVHINRTFSRMEDVQFTNPYPSKMTCYTNQSALPNPEFQMWLRSSMQPHWEQPLDELYSSPASLSPTPDFSTGLLSGPPASSIKRQTLVHKTSQLCKDRDKSPSYAVLLLHFYTKVVSKIRMHGLFGRKYLLSFLFVCLLCLVILLDPYGYRYKPDGALLDHQAKDLGESSQAPGFAETQNIQAHSPTSSSGGEVRPELHVGTSSTMFPTVDASPRNQTEPAEDDVEMEAFYVSLDADTCVVSWEETRKALKIVQDLISKDASVFLHPKLASVMKTNLEYRSNSSADDDISRDIRLQLSETSLESTHWCWDDYIEARMKIESTVEANKNQFWEVVALENELRQKLAWMEGKKKYLEEQINVIKANIAASQSEKNMASQRKRDIFKEGKKLKAQRYELREQAPYSQDEHGWENETQTRIKSEWPEFREYFEGIATEGDE
ncbi:uncharacterized protein LOC133318484 [Gastrolobium bilobum]|uniref:uncharacterized protein LOC133318484 n=1 Tax=Gastrolobium bilobum TaxID=150636 RepID=UPI002AAFA7AB|nr:uncharacterized protein LOC133318484 [Gastrolobium bilobum]